MDSFEGEIVDMVGNGWVKPHSARLWVRSSRPGVLRVRLYDEERTLLDEGLVALAHHEARDGTASFCWPDDVNGASTPLEPNRVYHYQVTRDDDCQLGWGRFETPPLGWDDSPEHFAIAVASCHQPFDGEGRISKKANRLVDKVHEVLDAHHVEAVILCGDQVYNDLPEPLSLFDDDYFQRVAPPGRESVLECSREEVRRLVQARYRAFWSMEGFQRLQSRWACFAIPDDHDIVDNWGSTPEHSKAEWQTFADGSLDACHDYQTSRVLGHSDERPESLHHTFRWGPVAGFVMDLRSQKHTDGERCTMFSDEQLEELKAFLRGNEDAGILTVTLSVPLAHVPEWMQDLGKPLDGEGGDLADRWSQDHAHHARDQLMAVFHEHRVRRPWQPLVLFGGDVHVGAVSELRFEHGTTGSIHQLISSPLTNDEAQVFQFGSALAHEVLQTIEGEGYPACEVRLLPGTVGLKTNPVPELNVGLMEVWLRDGRCYFRLKLLALGDDGEPVIVYESAELPGPRGGGPEARGEYVDEDP